MLAAPWLVYLLAGGFARTPGKVELTAEMIRIVFPYILFVSLVSLAGSVLNVYRRFAIPAFTPVLLNVSIIGAAIFLARYFDPPILALAWGVFIGGVAQLAFQIAPLARLAMLPRPRFDWRDEGVRRVLLLMGPAIIGVSAAQISALINTQLAALLGDGRISWITYADRLMEFPSALLGVALGTVLLPSLAKHHSDDDHAGYASLLDWGMRLAFLLALPAAFALWLLALPLITTLYQYGKFGVNDVWQTRSALLGYSFGLLGLILVKILAPGFYARQQIKTPVKIAFVTVLVTQTLAVMLMWPLGHAGLTLATSVGACVNAALLFWFLRKSRRLRRAAGLVPVPVPAAGGAGRAGGRAVLHGRSRAVVARCRALGEGRPAGRHRRGGCGRVLRRAVPAGFPVRGLQPAGVTKGQTLGCLEPPPEGQTLGSLEVPPLRV